MAPIANGLTNTVWLSMLSQIINNGEEFLIRGRYCRELRGFQTRLNMTAPVVTVRERKLGYKFMPGEAHWILSGSNKVEEIAKYSKRMREYSDDGVTLFGAYGPRIISQLESITDAMHRDLWTRQAVINIWRECPPVSKDIPCTLSMQFLARAGKLHTIVSMRSSDAWLGWPYDVFSFSMVTAYLSLLLRQKEIATLQLGTLTLTAGSAHLYQDNVSDAIKLVQSHSCWDYRPMSIYGFLSPDDLVEHLGLLAQADFELVKHPFLFELRNVNRTKQQHEQTTKTDNDAGGSPQIQTD